MIFRNRFFCIILGAENYENDFGAKFGVSPGQPKFTGKIKGVKVLMQFYTDSIFKGPKLKSVSKNNFSETFVKVL